VSCGIRGRSLLCAAIVQGPVSRRVPRPSQLERVDVTVPEAVDGRVAIAGGRLVQIDEPAILAEIESEFRGLSERFDEAEASVAPILEAVGRIYRRSLAMAIPADTFEARLPDASTGPRP
jgi:guanine deaminase